MVFEADGRLILPFQILNKLYLCVVSFCDVLCDAEEDGFEPGFADQGMTFHHKLHGMLAQILRLHLNKLVYARILAILALRIIEPHNRIPKTKTHFTKVNMIHIILPTFNIAHHKFTARRKQNRPVFFIFYSRFRSKKLSYSSASFTVDVEVNI